MHPAVADALDRWNAAHPWSHDDLYARWLLRRLPRAPGTTLDVGSGTGDLVRALAGRGARAHGIDADPRVVAAARDVRPQVPGATFAVGDALDLGGRRYDVVTAVAVLHHLPAEEALTRWRDALGPATAMLAEVRECVARVLPGARVRRRLFWRWTLVHRAPA